MERNDCVQSMNHINEGEGKTSKVIVFNQKNHINEGEV
jgi:hypothetical protein